MNKITIEDRGFNYLWLYMDGQRVGIFYNRVGVGTLLYHLARKYADKEMPDCVASAFRRNTEEARRARYVRPKLPRAPLPSELIKISAHDREVGWDFVVTEVTIRHPDGGYWEKTLRSPHYPKGEWSYICYLIKKRQISEGEASRLRRIAEKEAGPFEIKMTPYNHWGWRGRSV